MSETTLAVRETLGTQTRAREFLAAQGLTDREVATLVRYALANGRSTWKGWVLIYRAKTRGPARFEVRKD